ncbi:MAG: TIGR00730 family Rossman fold protein [Rickettsiales bacterium]|nr:TIGR00730 family Rossman fold protein [Rickettsiales bacterium]
MSIKNICVFCGAQNAVPEKHLELGTQLGEKMAANEKTLVYGGGDCGVMGRIANSVMSKGGWVTGVFPRSLRNIENEHQSLSEIIIVDGMHERKQIMYQKSDAFLVLPGGFGTMDELFEILTWKQLQLHDKPIIIFNHEGYWDHLVALMDNIINTGFAREENRSYYKVVNSMDELLPLIEM